ncbi:MAG TPA: hypothetical protein ENN20_00985 [Candidatus Marinimicrobia bacterium]|nr:hypothetical protein [Candidatus Neomarinimicrobiota bacterium]
MKIYRQILLLIPLCSLLPAQKLEYDGMRYHGESVKEYNISEKGSLVMKKIRGDIKIVGAARDNVTVTEHFRINTYSEKEAEKILRTHRAKYIQKGNVLTIEGGDNFRRYQNDFTIQVPTNFNLNIDVVGGDIVTETVNGIVEVHTSGGDIDILETTGKLTVNTSGGDISIRESGAEIRAITSGGDIVLNKISGNLFAKTSGGDITVKQLTGDGEIKTSGGDIYITGIKGSFFRGSTSGGDIGGDDIDAELTLNTSGGDITLGKANSRARLETSGGDIDVKEINGNLAATTSGGDIEIGRVSGECILKTSGGNIEVRLAEDKIHATTSGGDIYMSEVYGAVYGRTSGGDIEVNKLLKKSLPSHNVDLASSGGDIALKIPDYMKADIFAQITVYDKWDRCEIRSDFPLDIQKESRGSKLIITGKGRINGGGDDITLKTSGGNIGIRHQ